MKLWRALRYSGIGVFAAGIITIIQGCTEREGALLAVLLLLLQQCSGHVDIYWVDENLGQINRVQDNGLGFKSLICFSGPCTFEDESICCLEGIALDLDEGKMYWTDSGSATIKRANLNGSNIEVLVCFTDFTSFFAIGCTNPIEDIDSPQGIALDLVNRKMYWVDDSFELIMRANLNGTNAEVLICSPFIPPIAPCPNEDITLVDPEAIAIDVQGNTIIWSDKFARRIKRASLNGQGGHNLVCGPIPPAFPQCAASKIIPDMLEVDGIALDHINKKMYWVDGETERILRANFNGTNVERILCSIPLDCENGVIDTDLDHPQSLDLDIFENVIYWIDSGSDRIKKVNFDGSNSQNIFCEAGDPCPGGVVVNFNISLPEGMALGR